MECQYCQSPCKKDQQKTYTYKAYKKVIKMLIPELMKVGNSFNGLASGLGINRKTITTEVMQVSVRIRKNRIALKEQNKSYEIDEVQTYVKKNIPCNYIYVGYAINRLTKQTINFVVGKRTSENLKKVVQTVISLNPKRVYADGLNIYKGLITKEKHKISKHMTVNIEREHLNIPTYIKPMQRGTICYSKSIATLTALMTLFFRG